MKMRVLEKQEKKALLKASRIQIENHFAEVSKKTRSKKWLNKLNCYRKTCTEKYKEDVVNGTVNQAQLISYIGASAITHIVDGWAYLGRAIDSVLRGDTYRTIHLAYYAELRAAMGLLGAEGIGIFDSFHPIVDTIGQCNVFPKNPKALRDKSRMSTHIMVWLALKHWAGLQRATNLLNTVVSPFEILLSDWMDSLGRLRPPRLLAKRWLEDWGLDLSIISKDRNLRNLASYRPSELRKPDSLGVEEVLNFVENLWLLFEPSGTRRFSTMERQLLKSALKRFGKGRIDSENLIASFGMAKQDAISWANFLNEGNDLLPLKLASIRSQIDDPECHLQVVSRAAMLLFVASSVARNLLVKASYTKDDLIFWWGRDGEDRGIWEKGNAPTDLTDLWADIHNSIIESGKWVEANKHGDISLKTWRYSQNEAVHNFGMFELVGMWAIIP